MTWQAQRARLSDRADASCEICGRYRASNGHHRKNRSQGGDHRLSNLLLLCGSGTTGCHGWVTEHPAEAKRNGWAVWPTDDPASVPVLYRTHWVRLDDEGNCHLLQKGSIRNALGHLHIADDITAESG